MIFHLSATLIPRQNRHFSFTNHYLLFCGRLRFSLVSSRGGDDISVGQMEVLGKWSAAGDLILHHPPVSMESRNKAQHAHIIEPNCFDP